MSARVSVALLGQIAASYRGCPIAKGGGRIGKLRAGDRVPDVELANARRYDLVDTSMPTPFVSEGADGSPMQPVGGMS